ncbi:alcohol dehydrogenase catalytic domain-containing protein [Thermogemmatispora sp.]|uniref:alcohol dehydrogenase catalytic domain-containing protein n=1 Tax=Thermogemmatispora sp. TaxID=1968838 RepID=UPI001E0F9336|nr:alcohol dehydrogenase catalytic domain-containing protein [Thermogemmatispora sp.]MBX5449715.1 alcohol dehydrogenase catalytic domain-containing protein [Thermogemmatispora sp.]
MLAAVLKGRGMLEIEERPEPPSPPPGYVRVAVRSVGICGSDVHYYQEGAIGHFVVQAPMVLGHEVAGTVDAVGSGVHGFPVGAVVALEPGIPCGKCHYCRTGAYNLCPEVRFFATPPVDGAMQEYVLHPAEFTYLAPGLTTDEAALAEPLSVGVYAVREARIGIGTRVGIVGAGPVGILAALAAESAGGQVTLVDVREDRVAAARQIGLEAYVQSPPALDDCDAVLECSGSAGGLRLAQQWVKRGGVLALIGLGEAASMLLDGLDLSLRGITVRGIFRYANVMPAAIAILQRNRERLPIFLGTTIGLRRLPAFLQQKEYLKPLKTIVRVPE